MVDGQNQFLFEAVPTKIGLIVLAVLFSHQTQELGSLPFSLRRGDFEHTADEHLDTRVEIKVC